MFPVPHEQVLHERMLSTLPDTPLSTVMDDEVHLFTDGSTEYGKTRVLSFNSWSLMLATLGKRDSVCIASGCLPGVVQSCTRFVKLYALQGVVIYIPTANTAWMGFGSCNFLVGLNMIGRVLRIMVCGSVLGVNCVVPQIVGRFGRSKAIGALRRHRQTMMRGVFFTMMRLIRRPNKQTVKGVGVSSTTMRSFCLRTVSSLVFVRSFVVYSSRSHNKRV